MAGRKKTGEKAPEVFKGEVTKEYIVSELIEILNRCKEKRPVTRWDSKEQKAIPTGEYESDLKEAVRILELLAKETGIFEVARTGKDSPIEILLCDDYGE